MCSSSSASRAASSADCSLTWSATWRSCWSRAPIWVWRSASRAVISATWPLTSSSRTLTRSYSAVTAASSAFAEARELVSFADFVLSAARAARCALKLFSSAFCCAFASASGSAAWAKSRGEVGTVLAPTISRATSTMVR